MSNVGFKTIILLQNYKDGHVQGAHIALNHGLTIHISHLHSCH